MNKIGILTGVLLITLGIVESTTFAILLGLSLMLLSMIGELYKGKLRERFDRIAMKMRIGELERYRKQHARSLQDASEWLTRFALRYDAFLQSPYYLTDHDKIVLRTIQAERDDEENVFREFCRYIQHRGVNLREDILRIEINERIRIRRLGQFQALVASFYEHRVPLQQLLQLFVEERRAQSASSLQSYWNIPMLQFYIEMNYSIYELRQQFSSRFRSLQDQLQAHIDLLEQELDKRIRLQQLEEWLLGSSANIAVSLDYFDQHVHQFLEFRIGVVYLLERIGYRVALPNHAEEGIDLVIERSGIRYGVAIRPLSADKNIEAQMIHEVHTAHTLSGLQSVMLITNRSIQATEHALATKLGLICIDREKLQEWVQQYTNPYQQTS